MHFLLHRVANGVLTFERLADHCCIVFTEHDKMLSDHFNVSVEALEVGNWRFSTRNGSLAHEESASGRVDFVAE